MISAWCINLKNNPEKFSSVKFELSKCGIEVNRFVVENWNIKNRILREGVNEKSNQILESHLNLYNHLTTLRNEIFLVLEDDVVVIEKIDMSDVIEKAPKDWDVIYLGGVNHHTNHNPTIIDDTFYLCEFTFNAHAFLVRYQFLPKIIKELNKRQVENDVHLGKMQMRKEGRWYGLINDAIVQNGKNAITFVTTYKKNIQKIQKLNGEFDIKEIRSFNKIFQIGFNKCGTTSLHNMFISSGLNSIHWDGGNIANKIESNMKMNLPLLNGCDEYDCYTDIENIDTNSFPLIDYYELLDKTYPNSLFILNTRPLDNWIQSRLKHQNGKYANTFKKKLGVDTNEELVKIWTDDWIDHHNKVIYYFKDRNNFIQFDIETEGDKLIEFLRSWSIPVNNFPHLHKT